MKNTSSFFINTFEKYLKIKICSNYNLITKAWIIMFSAMSVLPAVFIVYVLPDDTSLADFKGFIFIFVVLFAILIFNFRLYAIMFEREKIIVTKDLLYLIKYPFLVPNVKKVVISEIQKIEIKNTEDFILDGADSLFDFQKGKLKFVTYRGEFICGLNLSYSSLEQIKSNIVSVISK